MTKSERGGGESTATPKVEREKRRADEKKGVEEVNAHMRIRSISCRGPDGQSDDKDENGEGYEGEQAAPRPLLFNLAHVNNKLSTLLSSFSGLPVSRCMEGNTEDGGSKDPENRENCSRACKSQWRRCRNE